MERSWLSLVHVRKLANKGAHLIACIPCMLNSFNMFESLPHCLLETLSSDPL